MQHSKIIKLLIADDHELVRDGIKARLESESGITIVGEASNGVQAVKLAKELKPDLVMLDINMPEMSGLEAADAIRGLGLECRLIMLSIYDNAEYVRRAATIGTNGYILKDVCQQEMVHAIKQAAAGNFYVSETLSNVSLNDLEESCPYGLTGREKEILQAIATGKLNKQIAGELDISVRTVESHRSAIRQKTGGGNAATLAKIAVELGLT